MKIYDYGKFENIEIGQKVFIGWCGSGHSVFGEYGTLDRATSRHLVFVTDSGAVVKTKIDNLSVVVGEAAKHFIFVSTRLDRDFIKLPVCL